MNWAVFATTYGLIFMAELGDKTQLATLTLATRSGARWAVFLGASLALVTTSALGVLGGELVSRYVSPMWLHRIAGVAFIVLGGALLYESLGEGH